MTKLIPEVQLSVYSHKKKKEILLGYEEFLSDASKFSLM